MPKAHPAAMAISTVTISSEVPWADRNRVSAKAPPKAIPAPMFPLMNVSTRPTTQGSSELTIKNRRFARIRKLIIQE